MAFKSTNSLYMIAQFRTASLKKKEAIARLLLPPNHLRPFLRNLTSENEVQLAKKHIARGKAAVYNRKWGALLDKYDDGRHERMLPLWLNEKYRYTYYKIASQLQTQNVMTRRRRLFLEEVEGLKHELARLDEARKVRELTQ